jgi:hypothetical protein
MQNVGIKMSFKGSRILSTLLELLPGKVVWDELVQDRVQWQFYH